MLRAKPIFWCALGASLGAACASPEAPSDADSVPLVGRLQDRNGVTDLTVRSFADGPHAVPTNAYAGVIADIDRAVQRDRGRSDDPSPEDARHR